MQAVPRETRRCQVRNRSSEGAIAAHMRHLHVNCGERRDSLCLVSIHERANSLHFDIFVVNLGSRLQCWQHAVRALGDTAQSPDLW